MEIYNSWLSNFKMIDELLYLFYNKNHLFSYFIKLLKISIISKILIIWFLL